MTRGFITAALWSAFIIIPIAGGSSCARSEGSSGAVQGIYSYVGSGKTASIPWSFSATLDLKRNGRYELDFKAKIRKDEDTESDTGTFRVEGEKLLLTSTREPDHHHELLIRGDSLVLETGWSARTALRVAGVPRPVFVKR